MKRALRRIVRARWIGAALLPAAVLYGTVASAHNPNALWQIVHDRCVPAAQSGHGTGPCRAVLRKHGYALLKDWVGPLQYLLIPTRRVTGIESPALLAARTPHYLALAWRARGVMAARFGHPITDDDILLAINSARGRTQNQLHVHISCIKPTVKARLAALAPALTVHWRPLTRPLAGHRYIGRRVSLATLKQTATPVLLARYDHARAHMGDYGMALTRVPGVGLVLLATRARLLTGNHGSAEELESHACRILPGIAKWQPSGGP